jgi:transcriptional regulator of acetoin/glycerol metabolism
MAVANIIEATTQSDVFPAQFPCALSDLSLFLEEVERDSILGIFRETGGVVSETANRLGLPRTTLNSEVSNAL